MSDVILKDLNFGEIDAKNELLKDARLKTSYFADSFLKVDNVDFQSFEVGVQFFVIGLKGTGKTAVLRYFHEMQRQKGNFSEVVLFKSNVTEDDRQTLSNASGYQIVDTDGEHSFHQDFKEPWKWYIYKRMTAALLKSGAAGAEIESLSKLTNQTSGRVGSLSKLFSSIKNGCLNVSGEVLGVSVELGITAETSSEEIRVNISDLNRACEDLISEINFPCSVYLLFDELELYHESDDKFDRDRRILRDLISAITSVNAKMAEFEKPCVTCAALRTEVINSVMEMGHEINRDIDDYGVVLTWDIGKERADHPLLNLIYKKIAKSCGVDECDVRKKFFPEKINNQEFFAFILRASYFRPRDIVRLLKVAREYDSKANSFSSAHFDETSTEYSKQTWIEITEELQAVYSPAEIKAIEKLFLGFKARFLKSELEDRVLKRHRNDRPVQELVEKYSLSKILTDLYRIGVVGNDFVVRMRSGKPQYRTRFVFRGNTALNDAERMMIHKSLWKHLTLIDERGAG
ncbi:MULTISPECIES: P-loop ATPase, Sll1717 family [unclassified Leisingera]|uniref:P-loop ATPase, Sll1717 family n=1 Tax=unclassified Leisingera TaxID=2614906 RepID=UPI0002E93011|nr:MULTISPECIES: hypothetical protein [unclassified Leisingera]KIC23139.1 hypothetical protein RA23_17125 [Leisingera sp. ANG-S3]KIC49423.1 hypothetical protein RA22_20735 [Leisingera sp. ANG-S]KID09464.1 hypothetical protein GC1_08835 [Leisingera sp. ANG1]